MRKQNLFVRIIGFMLVFLLAMTSEMINFAITAYAAGTGTGSPLFISLDWVDSEFKNGTAFNLQEDDNTTNAVKMKVSYQSELIREEGYAPGELIITVKGIGNVNRSGVIEALVGADKEGSSVKTRDWSYTWNRANDTYTLTNNEAIKGNSVFSGYFELVWNIKARDSIHGYTQNGMQASLYLPEGDSVSSNALSFSNVTKADTFSVHIDQHEMYSYEGLTNGIENPEDYAFVRYNLGATDHYNSRGLSSHYYLFDPDSDAVGSGAIVISPALSCADKKDGTYSVGISTSTSMEKQYIFVAYPKSEYVNKIVTASIAKYGAYNEGDDSGNPDILLLAQDSISVPVPADFNFIDIPGTVYEFWKDTYYDKNVSSTVTQAKGGDISGAKMKGKTTETFYLEGLLNNPWSGCTLEIVDDFLYILRDDGNFRQLEAGEYEFEKIKIPGVNSLRNINDIPIAEDTYKVYVYAMPDGSTYSRNTTTPFWEGVLKTDSQAISLPENTTAIAVVIEGIKESIKRYSIPVDVKFNIKDTSGLVYEQQDNLTSGQVVNTSFIKVYSISADETVAWFNSDFTAEHYIDDTNLNLAQKDIDIYGSYLDRERDNITFYTGEKNDYRAYTDLSEIGEEGNRFTNTFTMGANFKFVENNYPNQFSLYTILDKSLSLYGYRNQEDIWDIMTLEGLDMSEQQLASACTPEIITDYNGSGRTYIALHFDFGDTHVPQSGQIRAHFATRVANEYVINSNSIRARSAVIIDDSIVEYPAGKVTDTGDWGNEAELFSDIDRDGNTEETLAYHFDNISHTYADSSQLQFTKYVKTSYSDGWTQLPDVPSEEYGETYQYKLYLKNGNSQASDIIVRDVLEVGANMQWQGVFQSVDLSECEKIGLTGTIYYSTIASPSDSLSSADWTTTKPVDVKAVAVDFGSGTLKEGQELNVIVNMKAPEDTKLKNSITENGFSASFTMLDSASGNPTGSSTLDSNFVQVKLTPPLKSIIITKVDEVDGAKLSGAKFSLIDKATGETVAEATSNERGYAVFRNIPADGTYIVREMEAPYGYKNVEDVEVAMNEADQRLTIKDPRKLGRIEVCKVNNLDNDVYVEGAEYTLYDTEGNVVTDADGNTVTPAVTDVNGLAVFKNLKWGSYIIKETKSPAGYHLNETEYPVEINRENVAETTVVETVDIQHDISVKLNKYVSTTTGEKTEIPLPGATFELVRKGENNDKRIGLYVTDTEGKIDIVDLPYGNYYFREYRTPAGYETAENAEFTLSPDNKDVTVAVYNQRKHGSVIITKKDNLGNLVKDVEFGLYDKQYTEEEMKTVKPIQTAATDEYGVAQFENLEWGTFYILETKTPDYYHMDTEWKEVTIDAKTLKVTLEVINETKKGTITLTKTDETGTVFLNGAEYTLYLEDGTVLGTYATQEINGESGKLVVEDLEWGSYYFKETKAPDGYCLSNETVRFSVNALNAGLTQEITVTDPLDARSITIAKRIKVDDINFDNGNPTFIFKVEGKDAVEWENHIYYRAITFDENYVKNNIEVIDGVNWVSQSVIISGMMIGHYTVTEEDSSRYYLTEITDIVNGLAKQPSYTEEATEDASIMPLTAGPEFYAPDEVGVKFDLYTYKEASATFVNEKYEHQDFSHNEVVTNILKEKRKLTALKVSYGAETAEAESAVDTNILTVTALYDDGTSVALSENDYNLSIKTFPNANGDYTVRVSYSENGITRSDSFKVTLYGMKIRIISLQATLKDDFPVEVGSAITEEMFTVTALYSNGNSVELTDFNISPTTAPSNDGEFNVTVSLDLDAIPNDGHAVTTTVKMTAEYPNPILETGAKFKAHLSEVASTATAVVFTDEIAPSGATLTDVSAKGDGSVVGWMDGTTFYVSSQRNGIKILSNENCAEMFYNKTALTSIDLSNLDTSQAKDMTSMFNSCSGLTSLELGDNFYTSNVECMSSMFEYISSLTSLDLGNHFDTSNVLYMGSMFFGCSNLTTTITIRNPNTNYQYMFKMACLYSGTITVNYTEATASVVDSVVSSNSNMSGMPIGAVVKGNLVS